jgi:hypothetical protein
MSRPADPAPRRTRRRRSIGLVRIVVASILGVGAVAAGVSTVSAYLAEQSSPRDMRGNPVSLPTPPKAVQERTDAVSQVDGMTLRVPSTGLDVPLGQLNEVDGVIDPPGFSSAYLVRNYGATLEHASEGTVFVVMHSCRGGAVCPGNYLINVAEGTASVKVGADIYLDGRHYRVTGSQKVYKPDVHTDAALWEDTPGRLVLFTCLQVPAQTESVDNMVITATLQP